MRPAVARVVLCLSFCACASSGMQGKQPRSEHVDHVDNLDKGMPGEEPTPIPTSEPPSAGKASLTEGPTTGTPDVLPVVPALPAEVNAGVIPRAQLKAVLAAGIGHFLRRVHAEPEVIKGHFAGWRIVSLFAGDKSVRVSVLGPGDTVKRANGQSIERPEQFQLVWDSMATANELVLDIERMGHASKLRYTIAD